MLVPGMGDLRGPPTGFLIPVRLRPDMSGFDGPSRAWGQRTSFTAYGDVPTASTWLRFLRSWANAAVAVNSMAAGAAVIVAAERPELIEGLVLVGAFVRQPESDNVLTRLVMRSLMAPLWGRWRLAGVPAPPVRGEAPPRFCRIPGRGGRKH